MTILASGADSQAERAGRGWTTTTTSRRRACPCGRLRRRPRTRVLPRRGLHRHLLGGWPWLVPGSPSRLLDLAVSTSGRRDLPVAVALSVTIP
jgi:hypothetical protein